MTLIVNFWFIWKKEIPAYPKLRSQSRIFNPLVNPDQRLSPTLPQVNSNKIPINEEQIRQENLVKKVSMKNVW